MKRIFFYLIALFWFASCYSPRYVYSPSTLNIPALTKKGNVKVAVYGATSAGRTGGLANPSGSSAGTDIQLAYAFNKHFAGMINQYSRWENNQNDNDVFPGDSIFIKYFRNLTEFGLGYFKVLGDSNSIFQVFGGIATGKFTITERNASNNVNFNRFHNSHVTKIFIQPAIIAGVNKNFTGSFASRFSAVYYSNIKTNYTKQEQENYFLTDLSRSPVFFWEPALDFGIGFKKLRGVKFNFQLGLSVLINKRFIDYRTLNFGFGVVSDLKFKKSTTEH